GGLGHCSSHAVVPSKKSLYVFIPELPLVLPVVLRLQCRLVVKVDSPFQQGGRRHERFFDQRRDVSHFQVNPQQDVVYGGEGLGWKRVHLGVCAITQERRPRKVSCELTMIELDGGVPAVLQRDELEVGTSLE